MNISKNLLSLGLIAIISGISTAQTYTATAGTNGVTDIQSDYSMSTGDGASVSVDVPLEFELPKKVMLSVMTAGNPIAPNLEFEPIRNAVNYFVNEPQGGNLASGFPSPLPDGTNRSASYAAANGAFYTNADNINFEFIPPVTLVHESGASAGELVTHTWIHVGNGLEYTGYNTLSGGAIHIDNSPYNLAIDYNSLVSSGGAGWYLTRMVVREDSLDPTDRAGKYLGIATTTITIL